MVIKRVFFFRHGETDWNRESRLQGHSDIPLNPLGLAQAERLARDLQSCDIELILSSDLSRALETGRAVARATQAPLIIVPGLRETSLGAAEGLTHQEVADRLGDESWRRWTSIDPIDREYAFPGGESKAAHLTRLITALEDHLLRFEHERIAVSTHGGALRRLIHHFQPDLEQPVSIPNCRVFEFTFEPQSRIWRPAR
jgi:probable phosphoglycerate mutase